MMDHFKLLPLNFTVLNVEIAVLVMCKPSSSFYPESGEVLSDHYKLLPIDLRDVNQLEAILSAGQLDSRNILEFRIP